MKTILLFYDLSCVSKNRFIEIDRTKEKEEYRHRRKVDGGRKAWEKVVKNLANKK